MTTARIVLTTIGQKPDAEKLALQLVERRLAACVNIVGPIRSVYRWKQQISNEPEYLLVIKTTAELAAQLHSAFRQLQQLAGGQMYFLFPRRRLSCSGQANQTQQCKGAANAAGLHSFLVITDMAFRCPGSVESCALVLLICRS